MAWTLDDDIAGSEERRRYLLALRYMKDKRVLEVACGEGWGTAMLATSAALVIGVDSDMGALVHARRCHTRPNVLFLRTDERGFPVRPGGVDIVVSLRLADFLAWRVTSLPLIKSTLAANGLLIIAVPAAVGGATGGLRPSLDDQEEAHREFFGALQRTFSHVHVLGRSGMTSAIGAESTNDSVASGDRPDRLSVPAIGPRRREHVINASRTLRLHAVLALCSDAPLPPVAANFFVKHAPASPAGDASTNLSRSKLARSDARQRNQDRDVAPRVGAAGAERRGLGADRAAYHQTVRARGKQIEMLMQHIEALEQHEHDLRDALLSAHEQLLQRDDEIQSLQENGESVRWQPTHQSQSRGDLREGRITRDELITPLTQERTARAEYIAMLERTIATKDAHIAVIEAQVVALQVHLDHLGQGPIGRMYRLVRRVAQYLHASQ